MGDGRANQNGAKKTKKRMTEKAIEANRQNAQKSTGPKTQRADGQAPNIKHGILASIKVLPEVESQQEWDDFVAGLKEDLHPSGTLEVALVERIAWIMWRLRRLARYEETVLSKQFDDAPQDAAKKVDNSSLDIYYKTETYDDCEECDPEEIENIAILYSNVMKTLNSIFDGKRKGELEQEVGCEIAWLSTQVCKEVFEKKQELKKFSQREVYTINKSYFECNFSNISIVYDVINKQAKEQKTPYEEYFRLLHKKACDNYDAALKNFQLYEKELAFNKREAIVPATGTSDQVMRMESHLNRQLMQTLHELQRLQAMRVGIAGPPLAVDVSGPG